MYIVTGLERGVVWNPETNSPLAKFVKGEFRTESKEIADKLIALGYTVKAETAKKSNPK